MDNSIQNIEIEEKLQKDFDSIYITTRTDIDIIDDYMDPSYVITINETKNKKLEESLQSSSIEDNEFDNRTLRKKIKDKNDKLQMLILSTFLLVGGGYLFVNNN